MSPVLTGGFFTTSAPWEAPITETYINLIHLVLTTVLWDRGLYYLHFIVEEKHSTET